MATSTALASALRADGSVAALEGICRQLEALKGSPLLAELVSRGPSDGGAPASWGARMVVRFRTLSADDAHHLWRLLEVLSDARMLPPPARPEFYAQFQDPELLTTLSASLDATLRAASSEGLAEQLAVRRCLRNLARSPELRQHCIVTIPSLVESLSNEALLGESAAALCNLACHSDAKERAVASGAVRKLVQPPGGFLRVPPEPAEDLVACLGVLTAGCKSGLEAFFEVAAADGEAASFEPLIQRLLKEAGSTPPLQCLLIDVLGGLCAAAPQFKEWVIKESIAVKEALPQLLGTGRGPLRKACLEFATLLVDAEGFTDAFQRGGGVPVLESILESERSAPQAGLMTRFNDPSGFGSRREPSEQDLAQSLMSKILMI